MSLVVKKVVGLATIQDFGRRGHMHEAVPPGGALAPDLLVLANRRADNPADSPAIEVLGQLVVRASSELVVATDRGVHVLHAEEELTLASAEQRCTYLAIRGGVAAPRVLDGHGVLLCAGLGAPLRANDVVASAQSPEHRGAPEPFVLTDTIAIVPGPDLDAFSPNALELLTSSPYRILPTSDRVGTRLSGPALSRNPSYREVSRPMVQGALEVPADGQPIVLGPEHPTTGGYPIIAVVASSHVSRFHTLALGSTVRFTSSP